jgi:YidC/Oxa1 family membrane protein insertase
MDRNQVIGFILIAVVLVVFGIINRPPQPDPQAQKRLQDSLAVASQTGENARQTNGSVQQQDTTGEEVTETSLLPTDTFALARTVTGVSEEFTLENNLLRMRVSTRGGNITYVELKKYRTWQGKPLKLMDNDTSQFGFNFFAYNRPFSTWQLYFQCEYSSDDSLVMKLDAGEQRGIVYRYVLRPNSYQIDFTVEFHRLKELLPPNATYVELEWKHPMRQTEQDLKNERSNATVYYMFSTDGAVESLSYSESEEASLTTRLKWVAFKQHFFTSVFIADQEFEKPTQVAVAESRDDQFIKLASALFTIPLNQQGDEQYQFQFYFGPNHYQTLKKIGHNLEQLINLGIFGFISKWLVIPVFNWLKNFNLNFGIIILILTIIIRIILLPLTFKSYLAAAKMRVLQPEVNELNEKYKDDPLKKQQELMTLYRKAGVNPLGGCIPALLQIPILLAMFSFFPSSIELRQQSFLWAKDLSTYDSILDLPFHIPFYGSHVSLFTLLMTGSILLYTSINMQMTAATNPQMKILMYIMPVLFLGVFNSYSAGLSYYYLLSNLLGLGQQYLFKLCIDEKEIHRRIQEQKKKPIRKSAFQQRLERMARERGYQLPRKR